jgi:drug/metabolite transporter (DMT)-like permease
MNPMSTSPPLKTWLPSWIFLSVVWGLAFVFIKIAGQDLAPLQVALGRVLIGTVVVWISLAYLKQSLPKTRKVWVKANIVGLLQHTLPFSLIAYGETHITSVMAGIANAATPLWVAIFALIFIPSEKLTKTETIGILTGFVGVLILIGIWEGTTSEGDLLGTLAVIFATAGYAMAVIYTRGKVSPLGINPFSFTGAQLFSSAVQLSILCLIFTDVPRNIETSTIGSILFLGILSTGIAFPMVFKIIRDVGSVTAATTTYAIPIVSTIAGVLVLNEKIHWYQPIGAAFILWGVAMVQKIKISDITKIWSRRGDLNP